MLNQPQYLQELPFQLSTHHILDLFIKESQAYHYEVIEKEMNQIIVMKENVHQIQNTLKSLVCFYQEQQNNQIDDDGSLCLVRLSLETNQVKCIRLLQVQGIIGNYNVNEELIDSFGRNIDKLKSKGAGVKYDEVQLYNDASEFTGISQENLNEYYNILEQQQQMEVCQNPYYLETTAFYMFHKIFCASNYGIGKKIAEEIQKVLSQVSNPEINLNVLKNITEELGYFISQIVDTLFMSFNFGKQETRQIMPFCRLSIEKYLYLRLYDKIYPIYNLFYQEEDQNFKQISNRILIEYSIDDLKEHYKIQESQDDKQKFESAVLEINKLEVMHTPREKLRCFQIMNSILKAMNNNYLEEYRKLCFILSDFKDPYTQIHFLIDSGANLDKKFLQEIRKSFDQVQKDFPF